MYFQRLWMYLVVYGWAWRNLTPVVTRVWCPARIENCLTVFRFIVIFVIITSIFDLIFIIIIIILHFFHVLLTAFSVLIIIIFTLFVVIITTIFNSITLRSSGKLAEGFCGSSNFDTLLDSWLTELMNAIIGITQILSSPSPSSRRQSPHCKARVMMFRHVQQPKDLPNTSPLGPLNIFHIFLYRFIEKS